MHVAKAISSISYSTYSRTIEQEMMYSFLPLCYELSQLLTGKVLWKFQKCWKHIERT